MTCHAALHSGFARPEKGARLEQWFCGGVGLDPIVCSVDYYNCINLCHPLGIMQEFIATIVGTKKVYYGQT
jgi:hypothetical protein